MTSAKQNIIKDKLDFLNLAENLGNVSRACKVTGYSRDTFTAVADEGILLIEGQIQGLERRKLDDEMFGEIETEHPGYLGSQDTSYLGTIKGVSRIYQKTFVDTYSKVAFAKLYTARTAITAADLLNDRVFPFLEAKGGQLLRVLTDRGTEYCGRVDEHPYQLFLTINDFEHTRTKVKRPQTNRICERFHKAILQEFYQVTFRRKLYSTLEELQTDLETWLVWYNDERTH